MVETVFLDAQSVFPIGVLISMAAYRQIRAEQPEPWSRYVRAGALFGAIWGISVGWMCWFYPDWMWSYAFPIGEVPFAWWYAGFLVAMVFACALGALTAQVLIANNRLAWAFGAALVSVFILAVMWSVTWDQYTHISTYAEWHATPRVAVLITEHKEFQSAMNGMTVIQVVAGLGLLLRFFVPGRRLGSAA